MLHKTKVILFGAGLIGREVLPKLGQHVQVLAFSDNDPGKHGSTVLGVPVIAPSKIREFDYDIVLISSTSISDIYDQLLTLGVTKEHIVVANDAERGHSPEFPWDAFGCLAVIVVALIALVLFSIYTLLE
ncbi:MAG: hypothetical protein OEZ43_07980 [Gammaproteobacteria bacterium]|nr:hypothetical protein [Gammaproteobacteria bacterium]